MLPASEELKIQGGRSIQDMSNVPRRKQQKGWSLNPVRMPDRLEATSLGSDLTSFPCSTATRWAMIAYPGPTCRTSIKDFLNSSQCVFVGLTKEILIKHFCFCLKIVGGGLQASKQRGFNSEVMTQHLMGVADQLCPFRVHA